MLAFHQFTHTRAQSAPPRAPITPVHKPKSSNFMPNSILSNFTWPNLLQMHQKRGSLWREGHSCPSSSHCKIKPTKSATNPPKTALPIKKRHSFTLSALFFNQTKPPPPQMLPVEHLSPSPVPCVKPINFQKGPYDQPQHRQ